MPLPAIALVFVAAALAVMLHRFRRWRREAWRRASTGSMVADTARGPVEWASDGPGGPNVVRDGDAPVVMVLHGGVGGWDQGMALGEDWRINESFTLLAPSRAGYLRTPLTTCATPAETADALVALLDVFGVSRAAVIGISGGGPTALQVAIRHPDRVSALVMVAAISRTHTQPDRTTKTHGLCKTQNYSVLLLFLLEVIPNGFPFVVSFVRNYVRFSVRNSERF